METKQQSSASMASTIREVVFGMEDGMVSTLGAITGIAIGSKDLFTVVLAGLVIIAVESISMGIGSYLSNRTEQDVHKGQLVKKRDEIKGNLKAHQSSLASLFVKDGWSNEMASQMSMHAAGNESLMLRELSYRELQIVEETDIMPVKNALFMYVSYIIGGAIPLFSYFFLPVSKAMPISIGVTLCSLFVLGAITTKFTREHWGKAGMRILIFGTIALIVGFVVGNLAGGYR